MRFAFATLVVLAAVGTVPAGASTAPRLRIVSVSPAVVTGSHFRPRERVRVRFAGVKSVVVSVRATAAGTFRAAAAGVSLDPCAGAVVVTAVGATGDRAVVKVPMRECAPENP